jgi:hypothetical protein
MRNSLEKELDALVDEIAPPLIDMEQLERLVRLDEAAEFFDGECTEHDACRNVTWRFV